jgi:hypothetical protein
METTVSTPKNGLIGIAVPLLRAFHVHCQAKSPGTEMLWCGVLFKADNLKVDQ